MIEKKLESVPEVNTYVRRDDNRKAVVEIGSGDDSKRIVVSYSRWKDIENWFHDTSSNSDYVFDIETDGKPRTSFRISRSASEIRLIEVSSIKLLGKSLEYILLSNIPTFLSFVTALLLVAFIWIFNAVNSFINHEKINLELMEPAQSGTMNITLFFLAAYAVIFVIKTFRILQDRYYSVREYFEISIMSSLAFNAFLVALIGFMGVEGIFDLIKSILT